MENSACRMVLVVHSTFLFAVIFAALLSGFVSAQQQDSKEGVRPFNPKETPESGRWYEKRLRDFVGKRYDSRVDFDNDDASRFQGEADHSNRMLVKRDLDSDRIPSHLDKRIREFVGKRAPSFAAFADSDWNRNKRLRDFVGKRDYGLHAGKPLRDFIGKRSVDKRLRDFVGKRGQSDLIERVIVYPDSDYIPVDKRLRDFVGKRSDDYYHSFRFGKRLRDFVGKRSEEFENPFFVKRLRDFVGKRADNQQSFSKRLRDFVGKRNSFSPLSGDLIDLNESETSGEYLNDLQKRLRDFVGKRSDYSLSSEKRLREFIGKRVAEDDDQEQGSPDKRLREFIGKRSVRLPGFPTSSPENPLDDMNSLDVDNQWSNTQSNSGAVDPNFRLEQQMDKRLRDFVGKRSDMEKRLRDFVGKRSDMEKRLRDFVGKRSDVDKRLRDFVGKRSDVDKRLRDFVGKRSDVEKRLRDFVGKRSDVEKRLRDFVGKRSDMGKRLRDFVGKRDEVDNGQGLSDSTKLGSFSVPSMYSTSQQTSTYRVQPDSVGL